MGRRVRPRPRGRRRLDRLDATRERCTSTPIDTLTREIAITAQELRIDVLRMVFGAQTGHLGGSFSASEIIAALYFHHLRIDPARPDWRERDRFLLSKGHAAPLLYAVLARRGFIPAEELATFRRFPTHLEWHSDRKLPGVEVVAGPPGPWRRGRRGDGLGPGPWGSASPPRPRHRRPAPRAPRCTSCSATGSSMPASRGKA
jgi:Transketolase, thiamine diphosphate binding domain